MPPLTQFKTFSYKQLFLSLNVNNVSIYTFFFFFLVGIQIILYVKNAFAG